MQQQMPPMQQQMPPMGYPPMGQPMMYPPMYPGQPYGQPMMTGVLRPPMAQQPGMVPPPQQVAAPPAPGIDKKQLQAYVGALPLACVPSRASTPSLDGGRPSARI